MTWLRGAGVVACVAACGPVAGQPGVEGEGTLGDSGGSTESSAESSGEMSGASEADATTVAADESTGGEPGMMLCGASDAAQPLALLSGDTSVAVLRGDGSVMPLDLPDPMAPANATAYPSFTARGDRIAVVWAWAVFQPDEQYGSYIAVFSAAGDLSWTREEPDASTSATYIGEDGSLVVQRTPTGSTTEGVVLFGPDDEIVMPDFLPTGPLGSDGWVRGYRTMPKSSLPGWMSTTLEWQSLRESTIYNWYTRADGAYVYLAPGDATPSLVVDTPAEATVVPLPMLAGTEQETLNVVASPDLAWLLVSDDVDRWWRIAVADGTTEELALVPPDDATTLDCYQPAAVIDDAGRILLSTRDASSAAVLRFDPATSEWGTMGERVTNVDDMGALVFGETALVHSAGVGETFCPPQMYERGATELAGTTQQLVRPVDGFAQVLPTESWASPDPTGACAGVGTADGVTIVDLVQDLEIAVTDALLVTWWTN